MENSRRYEMRKFVAPEIIIGVDARLLIDRYLGHFNAKRPMIVTDKGIKQLPWFQEIVKRIEDKTESIVLFDEFTPNPKDFEVMMGAEIFLSSDCDLLIAIGGGSPIDGAKGISIVSTNGGYILDYEGVDEIRLPGPPLICIPSTAGTSADVSQFAIIQDTAEYVKRAIISKKVVPDLALLDPMPLMSMSPYLTACTGMDALTHAIEAFVSNASSALTDVHARESIRLIHQNLRKAVLEEKTLETMYQMMLASLQAGLAFSNASLGAVHAMAHSMGGLLDLPHGECNSILLEHIIALNFDSAADSYRQICYECSNHDFSTLDNAQVLSRLLHEIRQLRSDLGIPATLSVEALDDEMLDKLTQNALNDPCMVTNPKKLTFQEVRTVYGKILQKAP